MDSFRGKEYFDTFWKTAFKILIIICDFQILLSLSIEEGQEP